MQHNNGVEYTLYEFQTANEVEQSWLISILSDHHFEGFEETGSTLKAFVPMHKVSATEIRELLFDNELHHISFTTQSIPPKNWNQEWERNFEPVTIANRVAIRAPFHPKSDVEIDLIIEPKMSFGTGHHPTTAGVVELMLQEHFVDNDVIDFGSGTGVLAILAEKLGAKSVLAIDNEQWAYENCVENAERNQCTRISAHLADETYVFSSTYDIILANINRHVILKNLKLWSGLIKPLGILLVSGILQSDKAAVIEEAGCQQFNVKKIIEQDGWLAISFQHS